MISRRTRLRPVSDKSIEYLRGIVEVWADTAGDALQVTLRRQDAEDLLCIVSFHDRPDFTVTLAYCAEAERLGIGAKLAEKLNEVTSDGFEIFISSVGEEVAVEAYRPGE